MEAQYDTITEDLYNVNIKLEDKEKVVTNAEGDVGALTRRLVLLEVEVIFDKVM